MYFRVSSNRGADIGPIYGDNQGLYIGDPRRAFGQGAILDYHSQLNGRSSVGVTAVVPLVRVQVGQDVFGVEKSLGEICQDCTLKCVANQRSGSDFDAALNEVAANEIESLDAGEELDIHVLVVKNGTLVDPRIQYLEFNGENYEVVQIESGSRVYERGNAIPVKVKKL